MTDAAISISFSASVADFVSGVEQAKGALQSLAQPFGEIKQQLASLAGATSQAFRADGLLAYRDALTSTRALEQSFAADRARAATALRSGDEEQYADNAKAARLAIAEEIWLVGDATKQKLAIYAEEARFYGISQAEKVRLSRKAIDEEYEFEIAALHKRETLGEQSFAARQHIEDMAIEAARRRDDEIGALTRSRCRIRNARINPSRLPSKRPSPRSFAVSSPARRRGEPPSNGFSTNF